MSLNKQMIIFIASLLLILLVGTFGLNLSNTKNFLQKQLSSHAQDTATSLGLSLSSLGDPEDVSSMETMINAVFDRGYYATIILNDVEGQPIYERENTKELDTVPLWFINMIKLNAPPAEAVVQAGWIPIGNLTVTSHTGYAYRELWKSAINILSWFSLSAIGAIIIIILTLRIMLKPLKKMEAQAQAIVKKEYLLQEDLPSTIEFREVVSAMNAMVTKLKAVFERDANSAEKLQKMAFQDSVTQLSNRNHFEMTVDSLLDPNDDTLPGAICLIRVQELKELNDKHGYLTGDKLMKQLADNMRAKLARPNSLFARLNGTELVGLLPAADPKQLDSAVKQIADAMPDILKTIKAEDAPTSISIAFMRYEPGQRRGALLANLDFAIGQANLLGKNQAFYYQQDSEQQDTPPSWEKTLTQVIAEKRFILFQQSSYNQQRRIHDQEMLIRMKDFDDSIKPAGYFMPAVEQLNKSVQIDKLVIEMAIQHLKTQPPGHLFAINLSKGVLQDTSFKSWLYRSLNDLGTLAKSLSFEMPEHLITSEQAVAWPFITQLKEHGVRFGIDHFGSHMTNMKYLQDLRPDYVKLDTAFSKAIDSNEQTRDYVLSLCELTDSLDIKVIAMSIENEEQQKAFSELGVSYFQGYFYGAPIPLNQKT